MNRLTILLRQFVRPYHRHHTCYSWGNFSMVWIPGNILSCPVRSLISDSWL